MPPYPAASTVSAADITTILTAHNDYRRTVAQGLETQGSPAGPQPPASNMRELVRKFVNYSIKDHTELVSTFYQMGISNNRINNEMFLKLVSLFVQFHT